jgi:DNA-binding MarR family transcriptional regulator
MDDKLLPSSVCTAMMRLGTRMATEFDKHFARFGLTQAQFRTLLTIWEEGGEEGIPPSTLAERLLIERATVSVLTNRMVERGWLARQAGENRRTFLLVLTEAGKARLQEALPHAIALADETLAGFRRDELRGALALLEQLEAHLREGE